MKNVIRLFLDHEAEAAKSSEAASTVAALTAKVYTSAKLTEIKAAKKAKLAEVQKETDEDKAFELNTELFKLGQDERAEIAHLKAEDNKAEMEAKRAEKVKQLTTLVDLGSKLAVINADKKSTDEDKASAKLAYDTLFDAISNQLLGSAPRAAAVPKAGGGEKTGAQKEQIVEWYKAHRSAGLDHTAALKAVTDQNGVARGSAWGPVDAYRISIGEKTKA